MLKAGSGPWLLEVELLSFMRQYLTFNLDCRFCFPLLSLPIIHFSASAFHRDTICDMGGAPELANYGEYSGAPSEQQTYEYAKTILGLMTKEIHPEGMHSLS